MARFARFDNEALDHQKKSSKAEQSGEVSA